MEIKDGYGKIDDEGRLKRQLERRQTKAGFEFRRYSIPVSREALIRIKNRQLMADAVLENPDDWICMLWSVKGVFHYSNRLSLNELGIDRDDLIGRSLFSIVKEENREEIRRKYKEAFNSQRPMRFRFSTINVESLEIRWWEMSARPFISEKGEMVGYVCINRNITELVKTEERNRYLQEEDHLTGLKNRRTFESICEKEIKQRKRFPLTLLIIDADNFKSINDTLGHAKGDEVLRKIALLVKAAVRDTDVVGRYGGDEFIVLAIEINETQASALKERIKVMVAEESAEGLKLSVSVGLKTIHTADQYENVFVEADNDLYEDKMKSKQNKGIDYCL